jgi:hypothetical protein
MCKNFENYEGKNGVITVNSIYGQDIYETQIKMIDDDERIGVVIRGHDIFLHRNEIRDIVTIENVLLIIGQSMNIEIRCC